MIRAAARRIARGRPLPMMRMLLAGGCAGAQSRPWQWHAGSAAAMASMTIVAVTVATAQCASAPNDESYAAQELVGAARRGDVAHVTQLLDRGTAPDVRHQGGWTALHVAVANGQSAVVQTLLNRGADPNATDQYDPMQRGARYAHQFMMIRAREFSSAVNYSSSAAGFTPLHYAALLDESWSSVGLLLPQMRITQQLLDAGADPVARDTTGEPPASYTESGELKRVLATAVGKSQEIKAAAQRKKRDDERAQRQLFPLEQRVKKFIVGQEEPVSVVASALRRRENGWHDDDHPLVFMFLGSSGVGKTEVAKRIAAYIHNDKREAFIRIDMSEYQEKHEVAKLIGSPPGYVGHEQGGQLTTLLQKCPDAVVLFDEVEKAHPDILNIMLQLFDEGRLTDGQGNTIICKDAIFVMTSNLAADLIAEYGATLRKKDNTHFVSREFKEAFVRPILKQHFQRDEFLGRIDEILYFLPFNEAEQRSLVQMSLVKWADKASQRHGIELSWAPEVVDFLLLDYDVHFGARSLQHSVNRHVINELAAAHEAGRLKEKCKVLLEMKDGKVVLDVVGPFDRTGARSWF